MKKTIKTIAALLIIGMSFTACTKDESPTPAPIDIRDAAEGSFKLDFVNITFVFVKDPYSVGKMLLQSGGDRPDKVIFIIMETRDGFTYGFEDDDFVGRYDKNEDTHTLSDPNGREFLLLRTN